MSARRREYESCLRKLRLSEAAAQTILELNPDRVDRKYPCDYGDHWHISSHQPPPRSYWPKHRTWKHAGITSAMSENDISRREVQDSGEEE